jgi:hypothetical protein
MRRVERNGARVVGHRREGESEFFSCQSAGRTSLIKESFETGKKEKERPRPLLISSGDFFPT